MATLVPHPEFDKRVLPRRGRPGPPLPKLDLGRARKSIAAAWAKKKDWQRPSLKAGGWEPELLAKTKDAIAIVNGKEESWLEGEVETLAIAERLISGWSQDIGLLRPLVAMHGLAFAIEVKLRSLLFATQSPSRGSLLVRIGPTDANVGWGNLLDDSWTIARRAVCAAETKEYDDARSVARALREQGTKRLRFAAALVFPDETFADDDLREALAAPPTGPIRVPAALLRAASDVKLVRTAIETLTPEQSVYVLAKHFDGASGTTPSKRSCTSSRRRSRRCARRRSNVGRPGGRARWRGSSRTWRPRRSGWSLRRWGRTRPRGDAPSTRCG